MPTGTYRQDAGLAGEDLACAELERRGYVIVARRYRTRFGEIDVIAEEAGMLVFVEVKARVSAEFGTAAESVPDWKQRRIAAMALDYLSRSGRLDDACRFDVVAIDGFATAGQTIEVIQDAFAAR